MKLSSHAQLARRWRDDGDAHVHDELAGRWLPGNPVAVCVRELVEGHVRWRWIRGDVPVSCLRCATAQAIGLHVQHRWDEDTARDIAQRLVSAGAQCTRVAPDTIERARRYLSALPPSISGSGGRTAMFHACQVLVRGFLLSIDDALPVALEYDARSQPRWGRRDVLGKLRDAKRRGRMELGSLLHADRRTPRGSRSAA